MSLETVKRVVCDDCSATGPEALDSENPVELARADGWVCNASGDVCPDCSSKKDPCENCRHCGETTCANDSTPRCFQPR